MSYTKLNNEIERYYKQNNITFRYNALTATKEEQKKHIEIYNEVKNIIIKKWIDEKKYPELISCAHGRWFPYEEFTKPLAEYFIKENLISHLKYLCEKEIRFKIEGTLKCLKTLNEHAPNTTREDIHSFDFEKYMEEKSYHLIGELVKWKYKSIKLLDSYIELLTKTNETEYLNLIEEIRQKVNNLTIKNTDLKAIKYKA